jgi:zinc protease
MSKERERRLREIERLNQGAEQATARWSYEGAVPFGDAAVQRFRLGNGLALLVLVDKSAPVLSYMTWYSVGSRHEKPGKTGLAHLFEHLMFNETEGLKAGEFDRKLEENGAESNAATWVDWTYYYESLPNDRLALAVKLESERMARLVLREPQVKSEKEVVANERRYRVEDDVEGAVNELLYKTAFTRHPYGWPTIGWMSDIEGFTPEDCETFYRTYYAPNNATIVVAGDVREADVLAKVQAAYGAMPASTLPLEDTHPEPRQGGERRATIAKPTTTPKVMLGYHGPALGDADHALLTVLNEVLFAGRSARLYHALVIDDELASEHRGWVSTFRDPGLYEMYVSARPGRTTDEIERVLARELAKVREQPVTDEELTRAKARLELALLQGLDTANGKAEQIGFYETMLGDPAAAFRRLEAYRRAQPGDLLRVARRYLNDDERTVITVLPEATCEAAQ